MHLSFLCDYLMIDAYIQHDLQQLVFTALIALLQYVVEMG